MKLSRFGCSVIVLLALDGLACYCFAGPHAGRQAGAGFDSDNNPGLLGRTAKQAHGPAFNSQTNPGTLGSQFGRTTAGTADSNTGLHATQPALVFGQGTIGADNRTQAIAAAERERNRSRRDHPTGIPGLGISPIPSATPAGFHAKPSPIPSATPGGTHSQPSPIPSATPHSTPDTDDNHGVSPIPSATPGGNHEQPSPIPSATPDTDGDHGISPIPSATPGGTHTAPSPIPSATPGGTHVPPFPIPSATPGGRRGQ